MTAKEEAAAVGFMSTVKPRYKLLYIGRVIYFIIT